MLIGVYGDVHITKNMRSLQDVWEVTASKSLHYMYNKFDEENVEAVVCLGDFFDAPRLEAKHLNFIMPILQDINNRSYPTYILLGNHEADSLDTNILDYLRIYENIHPITSLCRIEDMLFIPYHENIMNITIPADTVVFTHHDIYGSELASGKTKAFFGIDPSLFNQAKLVMNGHVHLKSKVSHNIINAGSILVSQQGEMRLGEHPEYYTVDTKSGKIMKSFDNEHAMTYLTIGVEDVDKVVSSGYDLSHTVLKVEYEGEIPEEFIKTAHTSWRKLITSIEGEGSSINISNTNFDMKNYLVTYIEKQQEISEDSKKDYITTGLELLST